MKGVSFKSVPRAPSAHHGGYMWMMSLGAGISCAAVSLLNNTNIRALSSETGLMCWWPSPGGWWCSQCANCMLHSSWTSSTSSTRTPALSTGDQSNNKHRCLMLVCVCLCTQCTHALCGTHYSLWKFFLASEQLALHICKAVTDSAWAGYETQ